MPWDELVAAVTFLDDSVMLFATFLTVKLVIYRDEIGAVCCRYAW